jgi:hypothetical protein
MADRWADWVRARSRGGDSDQMARWATLRESYHDGILRRAELKPGERLLDVGNEDGLVGLEALTIVGPEAW